MTATGSREGNNLHNAAGDAPDPHGDSKVDDDEEEEHRTLNTHVCSQ